MQSESTESTRMLELWAWVELHKKQVLWAAGGALGVLIIVYLVLYQRAQTELAASRQLLSLKALGGADEAGGTAAPTEFLKVAKEFSSTRSAERALLLAAGALYGEGKYAEAQGQFEKFLSDYSGSTLAPIAAFGVASSLDAQDKTKEAQAAYQSVIEKYPSDAAANRARLSLAGLYELEKKPEMALKLYDEMLTPAARGQGANDARKKRDDLLREHPALAPTNALPVVAPVKPATATTAAAKTNAAAAKK